MKLALFVGVTAALLPALALAAQFQPGTYLEQDFFLTATPENGGSCALGIGASVTDLFTYPGPGKTGATQRQSMNVPSFGPLNAIFIATYPSTPAAGATSWAGVTSYEILSGNGQVLASGNIEFATSFGYIDANSFTTTGTLKQLNSSGQIICTNTAQSTFIRTGALH